MNNKTVSGNHNHRFLKWLSTVLGMLLVAAVIALVSTIKQHGVAVAQLQTTVKLIVEETIPAVQKDADKSTKKWEDWAFVLKVPERDQRQDSAIEELTHQHEETARRLRILERREE